MVKVAPGRGANTHTILPITVYSAVSDALSPPTGQVTKTDRRTDGRTDGQTDRNTDSSITISADIPISYCFHVKVGSAVGRQVSQVIPEVSRRCDVTPEVETLT